MKLSNRHRTIIAGTVYFNNKKLPLPTLLEPGEKEKIFLLTPACRICHPVAPCSLFLCCVFLTNRSSSSSGPGLELTAHEGSQAEENENTPEKRRNTHFSPLSPPWRCIPIRYSSATESVVREREGERDEMILSGRVREKVREGGSERESPCVCTGGWSSVLYDSCLSLCLSPLRAFLPDRKARGQLFLQ